MEQFGTKDLYKVAIRATRNMKVGNREVVAGEPLMYLTKAQIFATAQATSYRAARGGQGNLAHIIWETHGDVNFVIQRGTLSPMGMALLTNLNMLDRPGDGTTVLTETEVVEVDDYGKSYLKHPPVSGMPIFVYAYTNETIQEKLSNFSVIEDVLDVGVDEANNRVLVDYSYYYGEPLREYILDKDRFNGYVSLEARYYTKGESGLEYSNILYVPKVKILSDISLRIGDIVAGPALSTFTIVAMAETINGEQVIMRTLQLNEDVDGM